MARPKYERIVQSDSYVPTPVIVAPAPRLLYCNRSLGKSRDEDDWFWKFSVCTENPPSNSSVPGPVLTRR